MSLSVCILGLGYIGLPTAAVLASRKIKVLGVDINPHVVETINRGEIHIVEPDLDILVHSTVVEGYLQASLTPKAADVFMIAVPTPLLENKAPDLNYVKAAVSSIAPLLKAGNTVILESTSPVGTTEKIAKLLGEMRPDLNLPPNANQDIFIAYCPERVLPGKVLHELIFNDRIIGGITPACSAKATDLYNKFVTGECIVTEARTAEMCKLTENSFRDVNIAFANELSMICDTLEINVWELIRLANRHPRVNILQPGPGVGGHCIAVDPWFIVDSAKDDAKLIALARQVNDYKTKWVLSKFQDEMFKFLQANPHKSVKDVTVACLGIAFKPNVDDLRESPALEIAKNLANTHKGPLLIVEPHVDSLPDTIPNTAELVDIDNALNAADIIVALVDHKLFKKVTLEKWNDFLMIDLRGIKEAKS